MDQDLKLAVEHLVKNGIRVAVDPSGIHADVYILTLPNGAQYECLAAGVKKLAGVDPNEQQIGGVGKKL